jgi:hypothetical protein
MKACVLQENVPIVETINGYETDQYIKQEERKKLEKLRATVRFSFVLFGPLALGRRNLFLMHRWKKRRRSSCVSPNSPIRSVCETYDVGGAAKAARRNHVFLSRQSPIHLARSFSMFIHRISWMMGLTYSS